MKRKVFIAVNSFVMLFNLGILGFTLSFGLSPWLPIASFLAGAFGLAYWMFHDN